MPIDKDMYMIYETYSTPNKVNHNHPSSVQAVKDSTPATSATELDVKGQGSDVGLAGNTPVDVSDDEENAEENNMLMNLKGLLEDNPSLKNIKIQTHNGNISLPVMEMWVQDGVLMLSVNHSNLDKANADAETPLERARQQFANFRSPKGPFFSRVDR